MTQVPLAKTAEYSQEERSTLLRLARESIRARLENREFEPRVDSLHLSENRGAFTTLHVDGDLRGCIGFVEPIYPLCRTICETAQSAAFDDPRFSSLRPDEFSTLSIEISVMSLLEPIAPEQVQVGVHGLMVVKQGRRGLLLPQVATEWGWDREAFLAQTCRKAGLPPDAWRSDATLLGFTAEVFGEEEPGRLQS